jgi:hypothetical protein
MTNQDPQKDVNLYQFILRTRDELRSDFQSFINKSIVDSVRDDLLSTEGLDDLIKSAVDKAISDQGSVIEEMRSLSKANHNNKKENGELKLEVQRLRKEVSEFKHEYEICKAGLTHNQKLSGSTVNSLAAVIQDFSDVFAQFYRYLRTKDPAIKDFNAFFERFNDAVNKKIEHEKQTTKKESPKKEPIVVWQREIENQGEIKVYYSNDFKRKAYRDMIEGFAISQRQLAALLEIPASSLKRKIGRIQDYIAEMHPDKPIHVRVRLTDYDGEGKDKVVYMPIDHIRCINFNISMAKNGPWASKIRKAVLDGTAILK